MSNVKRLEKVSDEMMTLIEETKSGARPTDQGDVIARAGHVVVRAEEVALQARMAIAA